MQLTPKQEKFCQEYIKSGNASQSYRMAYNTLKMNNSSIDKEAHKLLNDPKITPRLNELRQEIKSEAIAEAQEIHEYLTKVIRGQIQEEVLISGELVLKTVTPSIRIKACEVLAKMRGYYDLKVNIETPIIIDDIPRMKIDDETIAEVRRKIKELQE